MPEKKKSNHFVRLAETKNAICMRSPIPNSACLLMSDNHFLIKLPFFCQGYSSMRFRSREKKGQLPVGLWDLSASVSLYSSLTSNYRIAKYFTSNLTKGGRITTAPNLEMSSICGGRVYKSLAI